MVASGDGASPGAGRRPDGRDDALGREFVTLLEHRDVRAVFQPMVDLDSGAVVALEALARGPEGTPFASPRVLFEQADRVGRVAELDWVCRAAAFRAFLDARVSPAMSLFVNIEAAALAQECPVDLAPVVARAESVLRVFVEVNERALATDPSGVLSAVGRARQQGWGVALDDVGVSRAPVAMLPIVGADLVKLDRRALRRASPEDSSAVIASALRHAERTGASLLVEGIEHPEDAEWARALGARYGQGFHLGAPGPLRDGYTAPRSPVRLIESALTDLRINSPFEVFERAHRRMRRDVMNELFRVVAHAPAATSTWPVVLACVGRDRQFAGSAIADVLGLAGGSLLSVVFGTGVPDEPAPGVRGVRLRDDDPLAQQRFVVIVGDRAPLALCARESRDGQFDVAVTQDPELVHGLARHLIRRVPRRDQGSAALAAPRFFRWGTRGLRAPAGRGRARETAVPDDDAGRLTVDPR